MTATRLGDLGFDARAARAPRRSRACRPRSAQPAVETLFAGRRRQGDRRCGRRSREPTTTADALLKAVRTVVADYEAIVRRFPPAATATTRCGGRASCSLDAFAQFGEAEEQDAGDPAAARARLRVSGEQVREAGAGSHRGGAEAPDVARDDWRAGGAASDRRAGAGRRRRRQRPAAERRAAGTRRDDQGHPPHRAARRGPRRHRARRRGAASTTSGSANPVARLRRSAGDARRAALVDRTLRFESDADLVRQVRIGRHPNTTTRVVLDAAGVSSYSVYPLYSPYRLVIDCIGAPMPATASQAAVAAPSRSCRRRRRRAPASRPAAPRATARRSAAVACSRPSTSPVATACRAPSRGRCRRCLRRRGRRSSAAGDVSRRRRGLRRAAATSRCATLDGRR